MRKKQREENSTFIHAWDNINSIVPKEKAEELVSSTVKSIKKLIRDNGWKKLGFAWSGGKDSQALKAVMDRLGVETCLIGIDGLFEYKAFLDWVDKNKPPKLSIYDVKHSWEWLKSKEDKIFPKNSADGAWWFAAIQHKAQEMFFKDDQLDVLFMGRRLQDGNFTGREGNGIYTTRGVTRCSPIREWTHEEAIAVTEYFTSGLAPLYKWPNGFIVGTHVWPGRQGCLSDEQGWNEVNSIDKSIIHEAAKNGITSAIKFLKK